MTEPERTRVEMLRIGDRIRISAEMIDALQNDPHYQEQIVMVERLERDDEGVVVLVLRSRPDGAGRMPP